MRIVLDTVVYVRALINPKGRWGRLVFEAGKQHTVVASPDIVREIIEVLQRQELTRKVPQADFPIRFEAILGALRQAEIVQPIDESSISRDADDDKFFWCAIAASADYIVSEDKDILDVREHKGIRTVSAAEFLDLVTE